MPRIITIGTDGDQGFRIDQTAVSRKHAILTIPDNQDDLWELKDNDSKNGTFIRGENGQMIMIKKLDITPMTFIQLGPDDVRGCSFYATRCLAANQQNSDSNSDSYRYTKEFAFIREELSQFKILSEKESRLKEWRRLVNRYSWIVGIVFMGIWEFVILWYFNENSDSEIVKWLFDRQGSVLRYSLRFFVRTLPMFVIAAVAWWVNGKGKYKNAKQRMDAMRRCPNPDCVHNLTDSEIVAGQCNGKNCGAHI